MQENTLKDRILKWSKGEPDVWINKYHGTQFGLRGHPDVYGHVGGIAVYLELKKPGKELSKIQGAIGRKIERTGGFFRRVDTFEQFLSIVSHLRSKKILDISAAYR